jgi:integrase
MSSDLRSVSDEFADVLVQRDEALQRFQHRYVHKPESQRAMIGALRRVATGFSHGRFDETTFPWELLCDEDLAATMWSSVAKDYARGTAQKDASALRVMLGCCRKAGLLTDAEYQDARSFETKGVGVVLDRPGTRLHPADVAGIVRACSQGRGGTATRIRDTALLLTLASTGARGDEVTGIQLTNTHLPEQRVHLIRTKSGAPRDGWLHGQAVDALARWIEVRGNHRGPLFLPLSRTGRPLPRPDGLSTHQARKVIRRRAAEAGYPHVALHDLRRFVITTLLEQGVDISLVAKIVGHKNLTTTAGYDIRGEAEQRQAITTITLPPPARDA